MPRPPGGAPLLWEVVRPGVLLLASHSGKRLELGASEPRFFSPLPTHWPVNFAVWWLWCTSFLKSCKHREENTGMAETQVISYSKFTLWIFWFRNQPLSLKCLRNSHTHCHFKLQRYFILNSHKIWHFKKKKKIPLINNKRGNYQSYSRHNV